MNYQIIETMTETEARRIIGDINRLASEMGQKYSEIDDIAVHPDTSLNQREIAIRAAAFVDGEGCFSVQSKTIKGGRVEMAILVTATNTNLVLVNWFKDMFGGSIQNCTGIKEETTNAKRAYQWSIKSDQAEKFIRLIAPFLLMKGEQARILLEIRAAQRQTNNDLARTEKMLALKQRIHELNARGKK